jgi:hypothetical protein
MLAALLLTTASFPAEDKGRTLGFWSAVSGLALTVRPSMGGWLTQSGLSSSLNGLIIIQQF